MSGCLTLSFSRTIVRCMICEEAISAAKAEGCGRLPGAVGAPLTVLPEPGERVEERAAAVVDAVAEDVQVLALPVDRRELRRRDQAETASRRRLERLVDAVHRVMVGEREQLHARGVRRRDHGRRR